jgi:hypothetical protein
MICFNQVNILWSIVKVIQVAAELAAVLEEVLDKVNRHPLHDYSAGRKHIIQSSNLR